MLKLIVRYLLERKVKKYFRRHSPKLVVITGSVGKTSAKIAIASVLAERFRVSAKSGNHNTDLSVPVSIMGVEYPENIRSIGAWRQVLKAMDIRIKEPTGIDVIVQELGTDKPGDVMHFTKYLKPDIAVVTAVSDEHMEFFGTLEEVAKEELSIAKHAGLTVINRDDIDSQYAKYADTTSITTYGMSDGAEYRLIMQPANPLDGRIGKLLTPEWGEVPVTVQLIGDQSLKAAAAAASVGAKLGMTAQEVAVGIGKLIPVSGRMQPLRGINNTLLIDDTYNSSPLAVEAALRTLYSVDAPQRIAILGSMNELGETSARSHAKVGELCDPAHLEWLVTIGDEAEQHLAPAAAKKGCQVRSFKSPYQAGGFVNSVLREKGVVLAKGSQNGVFAEEALKVLIASGEDEKRLVRQSPFWMEKKNDQFSQFTAETTEDN
jgi:UDP-N-acetylmuramoyl-tripeptide--D-alanyl-D-alanine ligase